MADFNKPIVHGIKSNIETNLLKNEKPLEGQFKYDAQAPGRIIQKSNLVIAPNEIALKEQIVKRQNPPKVPPKPNKEVLDSYVST